MAKLTGKVAVVTGASRGVGRGVALGLGEAGATVWVTGRNPALLERTAADVSATGGTGIAIACDHYNDAEVEAAFARVLREHGAIDILVNNAWDGYRDMVVDGEFTWPDPFWKQPIWRWRAQIDGGLRAAFTASRLAASAMVERKRGLIVNISFWAGRKYNGNVIYGVAKTGVDRLAADMAHDLRDHNVAAISLYPGLVRTEAVMENAQFFDMSNSESPEFIGRAVAALAADPNVITKSGQVLIAAELALEYGFTDIDGKRPRPLTLAEI